MPHASMRSRDAPQRNGSRMNVLYIVADDLRAEFSFNTPWLPLRTPNFDALAEGSTYFGLAFAQTAFCVPSRASFLTSLRPQRTRTVHNDQRMRMGQPSGSPLRPGWTVFDAFRRAGWATAAAGKIFHYSEGHPALTEPVMKSTHDLLGRPCDSAAATDVVEPDVPADSRYGFPKACALPFGKFVDQKTVAVAVWHLRRLANGTRPWLLACGFSRPHNPYHFPVQHLRRVPAANATDLPAVRWRHPSQPSIAFADSIACRLRGCSREQRRFYRGAVSFVDSLLGLLLSELTKRPALDASTLVALHADHGFSLGENGAWQKRTNFDAATRVPLFVRDPRAPATFGRVVVREPVELIDVLPTLFDLSNAAARLPTPRRWQGRSLRPLMAADGGHATAAARAPRDEESEGRPARYAFMLAPRLVYVRRRRGSTTQFLSRPILDGTVAAVEATDHRREAAASAAAGGGGAWVGTKAKDTATMQSHGIPLNCTFDVLTPNGWGPARSCQFFAMGYSVRSRAWRYTRWERWPPAGLNLARASSHAGFERQAAEDSLWTVGEGKLLAEELYNYTSLAEGAALSDGRAEKVNLLAAAGGSEAAPASQLPAEIGRTKARLYRALLRHRERPLSAVPT